MLLGTILRRLEDEEGATVALEALGDIVLLADVQAIGAVHEESPGAYASGATRRFAAAASDEDWLALMTALEHGDDPARITLERMVRWSLARDREALAGPSGGCGGRCTCGEARADHAHP